MTTYRPRSRCPKCGRPPGIEVPEAQVRRAARDRGAAKVMRVQCRDGRCRSVWWVTAREVARSRAMPNGANGRNGAPRRTPLPEDLPGRDLLVQAGVGSVEAVLERQELRSLPGIGPATERKVFQRLDVGALTAEHH